MYGVRPLHVWLYAHGVRYDAQRESIDSSSVVDIMLNSNKKTRELTDKQAKYLELRCSGLSKNDSYRQAYEPKKTASSESIGANAAKLEKDPRIGPVIEQALRERRENSTILAGITRDWIAEQYQWFIDAAKMTPKSFSAGIAATKALAELADLDRSIRAEYRTVVVDVAPNSTVQEKIEAVQDMILNGKLSSSHGKELLEVLNMSDLSKQFEELKKQVEGITKPNSKPKDGDGEWQ